MESITPTQSMVNSYWNRNGESFTPPSVTDRASAYNNGNYSPAYLNEFKNRDTRLYASILYPGALWNSLEPGMYSLGIKVEVIFQKLDIIIANW